MDLIMLNLILLIIISLIFAVSIIELKKYIDEVSFSVRKQKKDK